MPQGWASSVNSCYRRRFDSLQCYTSQQGLTTVKIVLCTQAQYQPNSRHTCYPAVTLVYIVTKALGTMPQGARELALHWCVCRQQMFTSKGAWSSAAMFSIGASWRPRSSRGQNFNMHINKDLGSTIVETLPRSMNLHHQETSSLGKQIDVRLGCKIAPRMSILVIHKLPDLKRKYRRRQVDVHVSPYPTIFIDLT